MDEKFKSEVQQMSKQELEALEKKLQDEWHEVYNEMDYMVDCSPEWNRASEKLGELYDKFHYCGLYIEIRKEEA